MKLLKEFNVNKDGASPIDPDNQSAIKLRKNRIFHAWTKLVEVHYVLEGVAKLNLLDQLDHFTKTPSRDWFHKFRKMLELVSSTCTREGRVEGMKAVLTSEHLTT